MKSKDVISPCCGAEIITSDEYDEKLGYVRQHFGHSIWYVCSKCGKAIEEETK